MTDIRWEKSGPGTRVLISGNGAFAPGSYQQFRLDGGQPRAVVKIKGLARGYPTTRLTVGRPELQQIRIGYHPGTGGGELHIVFDLADPLARIESVEAEGSRLVVTIGR